MLALTTTMNGGLRREAPLIDFISSLDGCGICCSSKNEPVLVLASGRSLLLLDVLSSSIQTVVDLGEPASLLCSCHGGNVLALGLQRGSDYYVMLFDTSNGTKDMKAFCDMQLPIGIISIDIAPCGLFVLIVCKGRFYLWDVSKNGLHCNQEVSVDVTAAAFTATGDHFVVVGTRSFSCWEVCRGQVDGEVTVKKSRFITGTGAAKCTFTDVKPTHSDGSMVALDKDGKLMMFNLDSGDSKVIFTKVRRASTMAVSAGRIFVADSQGVKVFDKRLQPRTCLPPARAELQTPAIVQMSPRSSAAWEPQPGATRLLIAADGLVCARYADNRLICWQEMSDGSWDMLWQRLGASSAPACTFQSDGSSVRRLATATDDGQIHMWKGCNTAEGGNGLHCPGWTKQTISSRRPAHQARGSPSAYSLGHAPSVLAFSACRTFLAVGCGERGGVHTWEIGSMQKAVVQSARDGGVSCISWDDTGTSCEQTLACGTLCGSLCMYGISVHGIPRLLHRLSAHRAQIVCLRFYRTLGLHSSDSKLLSCDMEGHVVCTTWSKRNCVSQQILKLSSQIIGAAVISSAAQVALQTNEGHLHLIDGESGDMLSSTKLHKQRVISFCSAWELAFCGHECGNVSVCDLKTRKVVQVLQCSAGPVTACYIDCRSGQLMTACKSGMHFWDVSHLMDRVENVHRNSGMPDNGQVLTECHSPAEDCGPIPSSFSPSTSLKRQKDVVMTAASMPVWRTTSQTGSNFGCDERVQGNANSRRLSISALRTSLCRQELQKKRAQEHASWLRNNLDDLDAMQHELKDNRVLRRSLTHVPITVKMANRSVKPSIEPISEQVASLKAADIQDDEESSDMSPESACLGERRASAPALSPRPLTSAALDLLPPSPSYFGQKEFDSMSSLTMPSPGTMEAGLQQITARTLHTPVGNQPRQHAKDSHCSEASVMWNQNDMFKSDAASLSSGTRCTDAITRAQVDSKSVEIFNQQSPQPLWDVSPDLSNTTEYPSAQPTMEVPSDRRLTEAGLQDLNASQNSCGHHTLASVSPRLVPTVSGDMADSPLLAHAAKTPQQLSYPQTSAAPHTLLSDSCTHGSRQGNTAEIASIPELGVKPISAVKVMDAPGLPATKSASPIFCRTTRRCLSQKASGSVCSPVSQQASGIHATDNSLLQSAAPSGLRCDTPVSSTCSLRGESFQSQRLLSAIPASTTRSTRASSGRSIRSGELPDSSAYQLSSCGSVTLKGMDSIPCDDIPTSQASDRDEPLLAQNGRSTTHDQGSEAHSAVSCSGNTSGNTSDSDGSGTSDKEDAMSIAFDANSFSQNFCKRVHKAVRRGTGSRSEAELRLNLARILSDGCFELAQVASELCNVAGGDHESITMFTPGQLDAWKSSRAPTRSNFSSTLRHLERIQVEQ